MFTERIQPLFDRAEQAGKVFKVHKEALFKEFKSRGVTIKHFRRMYYLLLERNNKSRTLKSICELFPAVSKKHIQELTKILAQKEPAALDELTKYQTAHREMILEVEKWYCILRRQTTEVDKELETAFNDIIKRINILDDEVRKGLKT